MVMAVCLGFVWLFVIFANQYWIKGFNFNPPDFYNFGFFALLIPLFAFCVYHEAKEGLSFQRIAPPIAALVGAGFMFSTYWIGNLKAAIVYSCLFVALAIIGYALNRGKFERK
jgi:drug/metabolite transporter (DMT)-like permease